MNRTATLLTYAGAIVLFTGLLTTPAWGQYSYDQEPLINVIEDVQELTSYRFLYREAMISNVDVSFSADDTNLFERLNQSLRSTGISIKIDSTRSQIVIYRAKKAKPGKEVVISGQVVDAATGERLPFATISWKTGDNLQGVTSNTAGAFHFTHNFTEPVVTIRASYVGYKSETVTLDLDQLDDIQDLNLRLQPVFVGGNEVIITGMNYYSPMDSTLQQTVDIGTFSPLGESNSIRALQQLPSVNMNTALDNGINVRGSSADGFQVLLDGITIYNQSHLFGLLDSFNADALQTSGLFYDITPAQYQAPPGGTLSLHTKTGSLNGVGGTFGVSNTTYRLTLEGPLHSGSASWLISGRSSYMNNINWLNNNSLIEWGLDVNRPRELLDENLIDLESRLIEPRQSKAHFFDLHGKLYFEGTSGSQFIVSGYYGQDDTEQQSDRLFRTFRSGSSNRFESRAVSTLNNWSNAAGSIRYQLPLSSSGYAFTTAGFSIYETDFLKDDFTYTRLNESTGSFQSFTFPFAIKSIINEIKAEQQLDLSFWKATWTFGASYHYYYGEYYEDSFDRPGFFTETKAHRLDGYGQLDITSLPYLDIFAGTRMQYYSSGDYLEWSPRLKLKLFPEATVSAAIGYSKNYQFLNKIALNNIISSDIWTLANESQPPAAVDYYSAGLYFKPFGHTHVQVEAYRKDYQNVRLHEINTLLLTNTFTGSPWFSDNSGEGQGIEFFMKNQFRYFAISQAFTVSEMQLQNETINNGEAFYVDWDRRYRYATTLEIHPHRNISLFASWMYATGTPNKLSVFGPDNDQRLDHYRRMDLSVEYETNLTFGDLKASLSVYNLTDRKNPWYRELALVIDQSATQNRFRNVPVEVYDLGLQPAFNISVGF